jgi:hypothetical protein
MVLRRTQYSINIKALHHIQLKKNSLSILLMIMMMMIIVVLKMIIMMIMITMQYWQLQLL